MVEKMNFRARHVLNQALEVLNCAMDEAIATSDIGAMVGISDRLFQLYQHLEDQKHNKISIGFSLDPKNKSEEDDESHDS